VQPEVLRRDVVVMTAITLAVLVFAMLRRRGEKDGAITRVEGALLLVGYVAYTVWLIATSRA